MFECLKFSAGKFFVGFVGKFLVANREKLLSIEFTVVWALCNVGKLFNFV
jgi:hypothetical protein